MSLSPESMREDIQEIKAQLNEIQRMVGAIAVQDERLKHVEMSVTALGRKHDSSTTTMVEIQRHQAACPRDQLKFVWAVLIPQGLAILGLLLSAIVQLFNSK